jgi:hypothetical protein
MTGYCVFRGSDAGRVSASVAARKQGSPLKPIEWKPGAGWLCPCVTYGSGGDGRGGVPSAVIADVDPNECKSIICCALTLCLSRIAAAGTQKHTTRSGLFGWTTHLL